MPDTLPENPAVENMTAQINAHLADVRTQEQETADAQTIALKSQAALRKKSAHRRRIVNGKMEYYDVDVSDTDDKLAKSLADHQQAIPQPGDTEDKGVLIGTWQLMDDKGNPLSALFNAYAAPQDLTDTQGNRLMLNAVQTQECLKLLKNWHGHNGESYSSEAQFRKAVKNGTYKGGWIVPPYELLAGKGDNLYASHDKGDLKGTFNMEVSKDNPQGVYYRSSTEYTVNNMLITAVLSFATGQQSFTFSGGKMPCRPVRLEPKE